MEKLFMTLSMTIPTLVTAFKSLKGISDLYNLSKAKKILGWSPEHDSLEEIISSAWKWHKTHPNGYKLAD